MTHISNRCMNQTGRCAGAAGATASDDTPDIIGNSSGNFLCMRQSATWQHRGGPKDHRRVRAVAHARHQVEGIAKAAHGGEVCLAAQHVVRQHVMPRVRVTNLTDMVTSISLIIGDGRW